MPDPTHRPAEPIALPPLKMILIEDEKKTDSEKSWFRELEKKLSTELALRRLISHIQHEKK